MITEESPLTRVQIAIGHDQISEISISMLRAFAALFTVYLKLTLHANHEYLIAVQKLSARNYSHPLNHSDKGYPRSFQFIHGIAVRRAVSKISRWFYRSNLFRIRSFISVMYRVARFLRLILSSPSSTSHE